MSRRLIRLATCTAFLFVIGCAPSRDTVAVTERAERPVPIPSTEEPAETIVEEPVAIPVDVESSRFDRGRMWTFDHPPIDYFETTYGFSPDSQWFAAAQRASLRFSTYCSASFISDQGLVLTNHHCGRQSITDVSEKNEDLLDNGFYASSLDEERKVDDLFVDQLVSISDVTARVYEAGAEERLEQAKHKARLAFAESLEKQLTDEARAADSSLTVEVIALYSGGVYSAYTFKRYDDVRLVMAPELGIGFFGGDPDNFTYPRYNLDMSLFRVYEDEKPVSPDVHFDWSDDGADAGETVFVVGSPGSTSRLNTVSQLEFERDNILPEQLAVLESRAEIMESFIDEHPGRADELDLRNTYFSILNTIKSTRGQLDGLQDPTLILRRNDAELDLKSAVLANDSLNALYGNIFRDIGEMQRTKDAVADQSQAFTYFSSELLTSHVLLRGLYGYVHDLLQQRGAPQDQLNDILKDAREVEDWPKSVERSFIAARLSEILDALGPEHPAMASLFANTTAQTLADSVVENTALLDSTGFSTLLDEGYLKSNDVTVGIIETLGPLFFSLGQQLSSFEEREQSLNAALGRAQFAIYGHAVPPDASFSPRISDGVVSGYEYNGTLAPPFTTFYGLYDRAHSYSNREEWELPERWQSPPESFDLSTPFNLVSTNDITGGNSGSALLNRNLEIVGIVFDSNIEALPNEYLFRDEAGRAISLDSRGMLEALSEIYGANRIVKELAKSKSGGLNSSETE